VFALFLLHEARSRDPMLPLWLFRRRNFSVANLQTLSMYGGLSVTFFFLVLFLQQVAGYDALEAGLATLPTTAVMFVLSKRFGALADRHGPRAFMGGGPLLAAAGLLLFARMPADVDYVADVLPGLMAFSLGLAMTVAPLTATVLSDADESNAGIASGVNNAIARVAGLVAIAAIGAVVAASFSSSIDDSLAGRPLGPAARSSVESAKERTMSRADTSGMPPGQARAVAGAVEDASVTAFHKAMLIAAALVALGGVLAAAGIVNPRREVEAEGCPGGQLVAQPQDVGRCADQAEPAREPAVAGAPG
jgi:Na+/melibiose symporter-like transporter